MDARNRANLGGELLLLHHGVSPTLILWGDDKAVDLGVERMESSVTVMDEGRSEIQQTLGTWRQRYERLNEAFAKSVGLVDSSDVYEYWVVALRELTRSDMTCIRLLTATGSSFVSCATSMPEAISDMSVTQAISADVGRMPMLMKERKPILLDFVKPHPVDVKVLSSQGHRSAVSIPIVHDDEVIGVFDAVYRIPPWWDDEDVEYLMELGRFLGSVLRQDASREAIVELRALEEGQRLCSEIHDNLAQVINALRLEAERASMSLEDGDEEALAYDLKCLEDTGRQASNLVRNELLALRVAVDQTSGFVDDVELELARFEKMWSIETELRLGGAMDRDLLLSSRANLQLLRILNEGLANVYRHAQATKVTVSVEGDEAFLFLRIHDNGRGFDRDAVAPERLGIRIMRERAESLGGRLVLESTVGEGTKLCAVIPRLK